ncbi:MAG: dihydroneopterin aldolase [Zymomonas mobilis]|uniref:Dihydroneopterin triphosphate 2'-epimerase n=1 Tax=Zymomonas mobilis TaxID=542 RepID=A0A542W1K3_ZYMMB|nr:dihydroneopterin aldolase [Zymomonas mobilis]TQL17448.1 dihydroneopterin aldolase [Zymomonas mobilis]
MSDTIFRPETARGLIPDYLQPKSYSLHVEDLSLMAAIGFHHHELNKRQRILVNLDIELDKAVLPVSDDINSDFWNYDYIHQALSGLVEDRHFNLQETLAQEIYDLIAARAHVRHIRVFIRKPDAYSDCQSVGISLSNFPN